MTVLDPAVAREMARISHLKAYGILDSANEPVFDNLVKRAARTFSTPIALISLIDEKRQWFKARHGLLAQETPRTISFCTHAIRGGEPFIVLDAGQDERFQGNPLVTGDPHIRFYAGAPLKTNTDQRIGTVCVIDRESRRDFDHVDRRRLEDMAAEVMEEFEHRRRRLVRIERSCPR